MILSRQIETFLVVVESGSLSKAAQKLYLSPASVMNQMNELESYLSLELIERTPRGIRLTATGHIIYDAARQIRDISARAVREAARISEKQHIIRIGTSLIRPCQPLLDLWRQVDDQTLPIQFKIVPFEDDEKMSAVSSLGQSFDCYIGPCSSIEWEKNCGKMILCRLPYRIGVPRGHRLAEKKILTWEDLHYERLMLVRQGDSLMINQLREDIALNHSSVSVIDTPAHYDLNTFNECVRMNYLIGTMDNWSNLHPSIRTLPVAWDYSMEYGIIYSKNPSEGLQMFLQKIKENISGLQLHF